MATEKRYYSDLAIRPGEYLEEVLSELKLTKGQLARRMKRPATKLSRIFNGTKKITADTGLELEAAVKVPAHIWLGLQMEHDLVLERRRKKAATGEARLSSIQAGA